MTDAFPQLFKGILYRPNNTHDMESPNLLPAVQCNIVDSSSCGEWMARTLLDERRGGGAGRGGDRAGPLRSSLSPTPLTPPVITGPNSRDRGQSPSSEGWGMWRRTRSATSNTFLPETLSLSRHLSYSGVALLCTDNPAVNSTNYKDNNTEYNISSVKDRLGLDVMNNFEDKGIIKANDCLIYNISLILCVPNTAELPRAGEDNIPLGRSHQTVDNVCDPILINNKINMCILRNQIVGGARPPVDSIPDVDIAITVPHSFNPAKSDRAPVAPHQVAQHQESDNVSIEEDRRQLEPFKNGDLTFAALLLLVESAAPRMAALCQERGHAAGGWGMPRSLGLAGGGESSLNTASGWGSPPSANNNNNGSAGWGAAGGGGPGAGAAGSAPAQQQWGNSSQQRPPTSQPDGNSNKVVGGGGAGGAPGWGGAPPAGGAVPPAGGGPGPPPPQTPPNPSIAAFQNQVTREASLPPQQGGGSGSPGGSSAGGGAPAGPPGAAGAAGPAPTPTAKEQLSTMRESLFSLDGWGGQHVNQDTNWDVPTSPEPGVKLDQPGGGPPMWKPNVNNGTDLWEANLRNGGPPPPQPVSKTPWGHTPTSNIGGTWGEDDDPPEAGNVWTGPPPPQQWGAPPQQPPHWASGSVKKDDWVGWGEPHRDQHRPDMHGRAPAPDHRDMRAMMGMDGRDMRGDPRGISGRLNGTADMWGQQHHLPHTMQPPNKMMPTNLGNGINQWGAQGPKDMPMGKGSSGWEEPSPPAARRNMPNFDDGTSLWGQQRGGGGGVGATQWKDMGGGMGRGGMQGMPPGMPPNRMPGVPNAMKPDAMWGHANRNGSWEDPHSTNWEKEGMNSWNEGMNQTGGWAGQKSKPMGAPAGAWDSDIGEWCGPKPPGGPSAKLLPKDTVWNSKGFRLLVDMGYKKDDVEAALRSREMNVEEAMDLLGQMRGTGGMDTWRRHDEHGGPPFDHQQQYPAPPRPHHAGFPQQQPPGGPFPQPGHALNISPAIVQKILSQPARPPPSFNQQNNQTGGGGQPSTEQLRMLVQQIQTAVNAGFLNHQILNQPLAPQTLVLLNQLLQQIKVFSSLMNQQSLMQNPLNGKTNSANLLNVSVQITKAKQQITNLQNQIAAQQAVYVKQQAGGGGAAGGGGGGADFFSKPRDPLAQLQTNFADISLAKDPPSSYGGGGQQSRLNQWKLPSLDKEGEGSEFSRAPGTTSKPTISPQLNPLALQPDNTWSTGRPVSDGWPSNDQSDLPDGKDPWPSSQPPQASTYTDLVPEFEPGKPWKMSKSIEDDPGITPGSVGRSALSLATIKDDIFGAPSQGKASPTTPSERSLSSSTWTYPPPSASSVATAFNLPKGGGGKSSWGDAGSGGELWGGGGAGKSRGPPPGLPSSSSGGGGAGNKPPSSWGSSQPQRPSAFPAQPPNNAWQSSSTWLLLKNLTAQIDGSTLKTLCMQHGPLQSFHLYLNHSIALAKYSTREEASKAQTALNNCVLGNTTIFAESPGDADVHMFLDHLGQNSGNGAWRGASGGSAGKGGGASDAWGYGGGHASPWSEPPMSDQRSTPSSSLSSFLPPDLLGGDTM